MADHGILPQADNVCGFQGKSDLYGLGVRLGLYFQLFATILVSMYLSKSTYLRFFNMSAAVFSLSIFIVIVITTAQKAIYGVEVSVILWTIVAQSTGLSMPTNIVEFDVIRYFASMALSMPINIYMAWYWFRGLDVLPRTTCQDEYVFFFAKVSLWHWFRTLSKVFSVIFTTSMAVSLFWAVYKKESILKHAKKTKESAEEVATVSDNLGLGGALVASLFQFAIFSIIVILPPELTIRWNKISGVNTLNSVSQIVPFTLGLGQLLDVLYRSYKKSRGKSVDTIEVDADAVCQERTHDYEVSEKNRRRHFTRRVQEASE